MKKRGFAILMAVALCVGSVSASVLAKAEDMTETKATDESLTEAEPNQEEEPAPEEETAAEAEAEAGPETEAEPETEPGQEEEPEPEPEAEPEPEVEKALRSLPEKEDASGILPLMAGTGVHPFPTDGIEQLTITWKDALSKTVYSWKCGREDNDDQHTIDGLSSGEYQVYVNFEESGSPAHFQDGLTYTLQLDWPSGDNVSVRIKGKDYGTAYQYDDDRNPVLFTWEVSETGLLSVTFEHRMDSFYGHLEFTASVSKARGDYDDGDPVPEEAIVKKEGQIDEAIQDVVTWKVTAVIPRCGDGQSGGEVSSWHLHDELRLSTTGHGGVKNDLSGVRAVIASNEYPAGTIIPSVENAGAEDRFAYRLDTIDNANTEVHLLNRCSCEEATCADWSGECGCRYEGTDFCTCWQYTFNATLTLLYTTDISEILQSEVDKKDTGSVEITNTARLYKNDEWGTSDSDAEYIRRPFVKKETGKPDDRDGVGQYEITFDLHDEDYSWADAIAITDGMDNLTLLADSLTVKAGETLLTRTDEAGAYRLDPTTDRDRYYSLLTEDVTDRDGKKTGETVTLTLWYPTDQAYTVSYEAAVLGYAEEMEGTYSNTVRAGSVQYTLAGSYREGHSGEGGFGYTYSMTLTKVDADDPALTLPGAVFEIWQYAGKDGEEDRLLAEETTGEDGTFTFRSDFSKGLVLEKDVLYYLRETQAPEGYRLTDAIRGFVFEVDGYTGSLPDGLAGENVAIGGPDAGGAVHIELTETNQKEEKITRAVSGVKTWEDHENADGTRPESITVHLHADGKEVDRRVVTAEEDWAWSFTGLDFYDADGRAICYTITEDPVAGYETVYHNEDFGITNRRTMPEKGVDTRGDGVFENEGEDVRPGDPVTYQIRFYNYKDRDADVFITDRLDDGLNFVSASDDGIYDEETRTVTWTIGPVPARTWEVVTFTAVVNEQAVQKGEVENTAGVQIGTDPAFETNTVRNPVPEVPEEQEEAPDVPGKRGPGVKTGDPGHPGLWLTLMAAGLAAGFAVFERRKKVRK